MSDGKHLTSNVPIRNLTNTQLHKHTPKNTKPTKTFLVSEPAILTPSMVRDSYPDTLGGVSEYKVYTQQQLWKINVSKGTRLSFNS